MGRQVDFLPEKLIAGLLFSPEADESGLYSLLESHWGRIDHASAARPFLYTAYYKPEMGEDLRRVYLSFETPVSPEELPSIKCLSNDIEESLARNGRRRVNIDPGLLSLERIVLASTKNAGHRLPLQRGVYGELTLLFENGGWKTLPWTYPDYAADEAREEMRLIREIYKKQRRRFLSESPA